MSFLAHSSKMLVWRGISIVLAVLASILLARLLGPEDRGKLAIMMISVSLMGVIINLGTAEASIYLLGSGKIIGNVIICSLFYFYALVFILLVIPSYVLLKLITDLTPLKIVLLIALTGINILNTHLRHFLIAQKKFVQSNLSLVMSSLFLLLGVSLFWFMDKISISNILFIYLLSGLLVLLVVISRWFAKELLSRPKISFSVIPQALKYGFHLFFTGIGDFGVQRITYILLEHFSGSRSVGLFTAANTLPSLFANIPQQIAIVLYSHVSNSRDEERNVHLTVMVVKIMVIVFLVFLVPIILIAEPMSIFVFGTEFAGIGKTMIILSVGMALSGIGSIIFNQLAGSALHKYGSYMTLINLASICSFSILLVPRFGLEGAAYSHLITMCLSFLFMVTAFCTLFHVRPYRLFVFSNNEISFIASKILKKR